MTVYLGIDPGTACGWAILDEEGERLASGTMNLQPKRREGAGMRYVRLRQFLRAILAGYDDVELGYESVRRHAGTTAAHVYGGIVATIQAVCEDEDPRVPYQGIEVKAAKLCACRGGASKAEMVEAARKRWGIEPGEDEADALWVAEALRQSMI